MKRIILALLVLSPLAHATAYVQSTTGNWNSAATWGGVGIPASGDTATCTTGDTLTIPTGYTAVVGTSPATGGATAFTQNCTLVVNGTFDLQGPIIGAGNVTWGAGSTTTGDFSLTVAPASTKWTWAFTGNHTQTCTGASGNRALIQSDTSGGILSFTASTDTMNWNCSYATFLRIGDAADLALPFVASFNCIVQTFSHVIFDGGGEVQFAGNGEAACGGWLFSHVTWRSSATTPLSLRGSLSPTNTRMVEYSVFDKGPNLIGRGSNYQHNFFYNGYFISTFSGGGWASFDSNLVRTDSLGNYTGTFWNSYGDFTNNYMILDRIGGPLYSGTVSSAATISTSQSTLTVSGAPWTVNQFKSCANSCGAPGDFYIAILSGTGANQPFKNIIVNSTGTLTLMYPWTVVPDATSTFAIYEARGNPHFLQPIAAGVNVAYTNNTAEQLNTDNNGDIFLAMGEAVTYTLTGNLGLPSAMRDNTGTLMTIFGGTSSQVAQYVINNNTQWPGAQSPTYQEGGANLPGQIHSFESNIAVSDPALAAVYFTEAGATTPSGLGPFKIHSSSCSITDTVDVVVAGMADYNAGWGLKATTCAGASNYYSIETSVAPGAHDIYADPQFLNPNAGFRTWAVHEGSTGSLVAAGDDAMNQLLLANDDTANPNYTIANLISWVRAGWAPTNAAYKNSGVGGTYMGAIPFSAPPPNASFSGAAKISGSVSIN